MYLTSGKACYELRDALIQPDCRVLKSSIKTLPIPSRILAATARLDLFSQSLHKGVPDKINLACAVKIGQQFSTRVDVLSPELVAELEKLQDDVPSFDPAEAVAIVEREIGAPISTRYEEFDSNPIAAASLGQVTVLNPDIHMFRVALVPASNPASSRHGIATMCCPGQAGK